MRFTNKVVIVTGAGSGIGAATARRFGDEGASVALIGRTQAKLDAVAGAMAADRTLVITADASDEAAIEAFVADTVARFGQLDVLVNNAGVFEGLSATATTTEQWRNTMKTDLDGVFFAARAALPHLKRTKGSIVNVASVSGLGGDWSAVAYNAAKGGVVNLTRALALDHGGDGVRVNAVCPSLTITGMTEGMVADKAMMAKFAERIPMGRPARAEEVAAVIAFLASDDAGFVSGVNLPVDGGLSASNGQPQFG